MNANANQSKKCLRIVSFLDDDVIFAEADKAIHHFVNSLESVNAEAEIRKMRFEEAGQINIIIKTEDDEVEKEVYVNATVRVICLHFGVDEGQVLFNGEELDLDTTFDDNGIEDGATISFIRKRELTKFTKYEVGEYYGIYTHSEEEMRGRPRDYVELSKKILITKITKNWIYYTIYKKDYNMDTNTTFWKLKEDNRRCKIKKEYDDWEYTHGHIPISNRLIRCDELDLWDGRVKRYYADIVLENEQKNKNNK